MHDTAFRIGTLAMNIYCDISTASILEVGSQSINGSLRDNALPTTKYIGLDLEEGEGVDIVMEPGTMPVDDDAFDLVIASSVFEHDPAFWTTFLEMCRKTKDGGYIYINAPSNGKFHRYPQDNWRFYPDSGAALVKWAISQGQHVSLVESFVADRENDMWNDFVAVFRKGWITKALPKVFLHEHVPCSNVITWKSKEIINEREESEDMVLLVEAANQRDSLAEQVAQLTGRVAEVEEQSRQQRAERESLQAQLARTEEIRNQLRLRENELLQRQEEIEQTRNELMVSRKQISQLSENIDELVRQKDQLARELGDAQSQSSAAEASSAVWRESYDREAAAAEAALRDAGHARNELGLIQQKLKAAESSAEVLKKTLRETNHMLEVKERECDAVRRNLDERYRELAELCRAFVDEENRRHRREVQVKWLREVNSTLMSGQKWWSAIMPRAWQRRRWFQRLAQAGLFNAEAYLSNYPDVAAAGQDPLRHYIVHGLDENRQI